MSILQAEPRHRTFWLRLMARAIDLFLFLPLGWASTKIYGHGLSLGILLPWFVLVAVAFPAYSILMHARYGQTLGKRLAGIRVLDVSYGPLSARQAALRDVGLLVNTVLWFGVNLPFVLADHEPTYDESRGLAFLLLSWGVDIWFWLECSTMLFSQKRRAVHDFIAGSVVVRLDAMNTGEIRSGPGYGWIVLWRIYAGLLSLFFLLQVRRVWLFPKPEEADRVGFNVVFLVVVVGAIAFSWRRATPRYQLSTTWPTSVAEFVGALGVAWFFMLAGGMLNS